MFVANIIGTLMRIEEDSITRYRYEIWFDYTRKAINTIGEGAMLAIPNFSGNDNETHYSILEVTGILPIHYALGNDTSGYPGFVVEAAHNAGQDWTTQADRSTEDTTKIRCVGVPTNLEIVEKHFAKTASEPHVQEEGNLPMVGHPAQLLDTAMTERIANLNIDLQNDNVIQIGTLVRDENVRAYLRIEELIKVHFGLFGFTGAGKSNLLSTLVRKLLSQEKEKVKIVFVDLMSEYTGLLLDQLVELEGARLINIGAKTTPESVLTYYHLKSETNKHPDQDNKEVIKNNLAHATTDLLNTTVLPKALKQRQDDLRRPIAKLLSQGKVLFVREEQVLMGEIIRDAESEFRGNMGNAGNAVRQFVRSLVQKYGKVVPNSETAKAIEKEINDFAASNKLSDTAFQNLSIVQNRCAEAAEQPQETIPTSAQIGTSQIIDELNDRSRSSLLVFQAHDPDALREFAAKLAGIAYESRRKTGQITPLVSFIFDEADEFIPQQPTSDTQRNTKAAAMTLARRGRKFGLGLGIATQRIRYLDTSILAQPHTYFVSKLPRKTDREAIAEAFGISEDMFRQTFKFKKGDWLLASYDAAGLEAIPIPIHAEDANTKILEFVESQKTAPH